MLRFQVHMLEHVVLTEVKKNSVEAHHRILTLSYYFIMVPANNLKKIRLRCPVAFIAITNQIYYETKGHFFLGFFSN